MDKPEVGVSVGFTRGGGSTFLDLGVYYGVPGVNWSLTPDQTNDFGGLALQGGAFGLAGSYDADGLQLGPGSGIDKNWWQQVLEQPGHSNSHLDFDRFGTRQGSLRIVEIDVIVRTFDCEE